MDSGILVFYQKIVIFLCGFDRVFCGEFRDEKRNLRFPCIQWKRKRNFVPVSTVYKGNANFVFRPWVNLLGRSSKGLTIILGVLIETLIKDQLKIFPTSLPKNDP